MIHADNQILILRSPSSLKISFRTLTAQGIHIHGVAAATTNTEKTEKFPLTFPSWRPFSWIPCSIQYFYTALSDHPNEKQAGGWDLIKCQALHYCLILSIHLILTTGVGIICILKMKKLRFKLK